MEKQHSRKIVLNMEENKVTPAEAKKAWLTGHFPYMVQAFVMAAQRVPAWRLAKDGTPCSSWDVLRFAQHYDETHPRKEGDRSFFYVTLEGAIGYSEAGVEFLISWLFYPMEPGAERDALVAKALSELERAETEERMKELEAENKRLKEELAARES